MITCRDGNSIDMPPPYTPDSMALPSADAPWMQFTIPSATCEDRVEEIYEDLCYVKFTSAMPEVAIQLCRLGARLLER